MELLGAYSNRTDVLEQINRILTAPSRQPDDLPKPVLRQRQRRLDPADQAHLVAEYEAGSTVYELAEQFRVHRNTVSVILERHNIKRRFQPLEPQNIDSIIKLYRQGWSLVKVGEKFQVSPSTIRNILNRAGINCRPVGTNQWH